MKTKLLREDLRDLKYQCYKFDKTVILPSDEKTSHYMSKNSRKLSDIRFGNAVT